MKLLLASGGVNNPSIRAALVELLGKPIEESSALCIPTASYGNPQGPLRAWNFIAGKEPRAPMTEVGWKSMGVLELTALPHMRPERWIEPLREADAILVNGGDPMFLHHWIVESGLAEVLPSLERTVWMGMSAGSMVMTPRIGEYFVGWEPPGGGDRTLGFVDFSIFPHLNNPMLPHNTTADAERWAPTLGNPAYAIDDDTAIAVVDGVATVVSEGEWIQFS